MAAPALELRALTKRYDGGYFGMSRAHARERAHLEEAEELCDDLALIPGGRIIARDTADGLRAAFNAETLADVDIQAMAAA